MFWLDEKRKIEDFQNKYFARENSLTNLNSWIEYCYHFGKFPGSDFFTIVPHTKIPYFLQTAMPLSPVKLRSIFKGTDAKGLTSFDALAA